MGDFEGTMAPEAFARPLGFHVELSLNRQVAPSNGHDWALMTDVWV